MSALRKLFAVCACAAALHAAPAASQRPADCPWAALPTRIELNAGMHLIQAEVAANTPDRSKGLMCRPSMASGAGMLFVFREVEKHCMWMRNTIIPLSVAFVDEQGTIVSIHDMQPLNDDSHCAARPARFALEMNQGWFEKRGIKAGSRLGGLDKAPAPR
jgi:uncharacterized membrane protein (UPF0127 family)